MAHLPDTRDGGVPGRRRRSTIDLLDDGVLVIVAVIAALVVLKMFGALVGLIFSLVKLAAVAGIIFMVARIAVRRRGR